MSQDISENLRISRLLDFYGNLLSDRQRDICQMYFNDDLSLSEISEEVGITRQGVRDSIEKGKTLLCSFEEKLGLMEKFEEMQSDVQRIMNCVRSIEGINEKESEEIYSIAQRILA
ncbi:MAG: DNA-binding protein [Ruminococcaceae bacterium]|nr:DNA-binding protein [Oscillospiraceae bacterium]